MKSLAFIAVSLLAAVNAATFKVIAPDAKQTVEVEVGGKTTALKASDPDVPYYTGEVSGSGSYKYIVDGVAENFTRSLSGDSTRNDFFNREVTYGNVPEIPKILGDGAWTRGDTSDPIWDTNYIPSIFVTGDKSELDNLITNVPKSTYTAKITFIGPDDVTTFEGCDFGLHKPGRKNNDAKQTWVWALPEGKFMANRNWFKIRHMEEDPTQIREKLYADIGRAMGTYANEANMVRLFINKEGMGTFNMLDDVIMYSYINAMFYNGKPPSQMGGLFDGGSGASFAYDASGDSYYNFEANAESPVGPEAIGPFAKAFAAVDMKNDAQVKNISSYFDYDQYLRFMVLEFLTGDWDGYWMEQTNDGAYFDPTENNKLYYLGQDFDATFGVNLAYGKSFVDVPYTDYPKKFPKGVLINRLLENPTVKATFESYLQETVNKIFNTDTLGKIVQARHDFYAPDLKWDRSIKQRSPGNVFGWTFEQTSQNLKEGVSAPSGKSSGGAQWGLIEWIAAKEKAVKSSLKSGSAAIAEVSEKPTGLAADKTSSTINKAYASKERSAAGKYAPQFISAVAIVAAAAALL